LPVPVVTFQSDSIRAFVPALIDSVGMRAHSPLLLERFGKRDLKRRSAMQFIETSSIHAHEVAGRCFVAVFSCRPFEAEESAALEHFGGASTLRVLQR
jgi:hypothetical protein